MGPFQEVFSLSPSLSRWRQRSGELLDSSQQLLPDELQSFIESACVSWDKGEADIATGGLALGFEVADESRSFRHFERHCRARWAKGT